MTAKDLFKETYGDGMNVMTPDPVEYGFVGDYAYEISEGTGITGNPIYGVVIITRREGWKVQELSKVVHSFKSAVEHVESLENDDEEAI